MGLGRGAPASTQGPKRRGRHFEAPRQRPRLLCEALIAPFNRARTKAPLKADLMQIGCDKAVCIFHFPERVISRSPFRLKGGGGGTMHAYCIREQTAGEERRLSKLRKYSS